MTPVVCAATKPAGCAALVGRNATAGGPDLAFLRISQKACEDVQDRGEAFQRFARWRGPFDHRQRISVVVDLVESTEDGCEPGPVGIVVVVHRGDRHGPGSKFDQVDNCRAVAGKYLSAVLDNSLVR